MVCWLAWSKGLLPPGTVLCEPSELSQWPATMTALEILSLVFGHITRLSEVAAETVTSSSCLLDRTSLQQHWISLANPSFTLCSL